MYTQIFLSTLLAATTALAAPSNIERRAGPPPPSAPPSPPPAPPSPPPAPWASIQSFPGIQGNTCTGNAINTWTSSEGTLSGNNMECRAIPAKSNVNVSGSGCATYYFSDDSCQHNLFPGPVPDPGCHAGVGSIGFDCSDGAWKQSAPKPVVPFTTVSGMSKRAEPTAFPA